MDLEIGAVVTGKVTGITKFGAFVQLAPGKSGLVHISEIANSYVSDIHDFLTDGQEVKVKIIGTDDKGHINLSIKKALPPAPAPNRAPSASPRRPSAPRTEMAQPTAATIQKSADASFEDKLKAFMADSDSKMSGNKLYEKRSSRRRGGRF